MCWWNFSSLRKLLDGGGGCGVYLPIQTEHNKFIRLLLSKSSGGHNDCILSFLSGISENNITAYPHRQKTSSRSEIPLLCRQRLHLVSEYFLESWLCLHL